MARAWKIPITVIIRNLASLMGAYTGKGNESVSCVDDYDVIDYL
jgi:hypothetical protein